MVTRRMTANEAKALALVAVGKIEAAEAAEQQKRDALRQSMLTNQEEETLIMSLMRSRGEAGATDAEAAELLNECISARFIACCVDLAAKGLIDVDVDLTKPVNDRVTFKRRKDIEDTLREALARRDEGGT